MLSEARQKKIMEKLNRAQKYSILGPQNLGSRGAQAPPGSAPEKKKIAKKNLSLTGLELLTLGLSVLLTSCLSCLTPVLDPIS